MLRCHQFAFNVPTGIAGTTLAVSGFGFSPKALLLFWNGRTGTGSAVGRATHKRGFGFAASPTARNAVSSLSQDAVATSNSNRGNWSDACVGVLTAADTVDGLLDIQSFDTDGVTFVVDDQFTTDYRVHCLALGGSSLDVFHGTFAQPAAPGNQAVTGVGFMPDCVILCGQPNGSAPPNIGQDSRCFFGAEVRTPAAAAVWGGNSQDGQATTVANSYGLLGECVMNFDGPGTIGTRGTFASFDADGFTVNFLEVAGSSARTYYFLALKGGLYHLDGTTLGNNTTPVRIDTAMKPEGGIIFSTTRTEDTPDVPGADDSWSIGIWDGRTRQGVLGVRDQDGATGTIVTTGVENGDVYMDLGASGIDDLAAILGIDYRGFTIGKSVTSATDFLMHLTFGNPANNIYTDMWI